jgi:hypothetical protein
MFFSNTIFFSTQFFSNCLPKKLTMLNWFQHMTQNDKQVSLFGPMLKNQYFSYKWPTILVNKTFSTYGWILSTFIGATWTIFSYIGMLGMMALKMLHGHWWASKETRKLMCDMCMARIFLNYIYWNFWMD